MSSTLASSSKDPRAGTSKIPKGEQKPPGKKETLAGRLARLGSSGHIKVYSGSGQPGQ